ncbi:heme acquisition protein HasA [Yersinia mollaretii]|uniref:heme acquisition protein HasA n=1 Tax=Yersinia mollaretii TaxID=33060 RepID=UPI0005E68793|nr:heme acquisition protein HasA [Yersinia mollaretii]CNL42744.1 hemophore HasA [Yersinia enterocolitica]CQR14233.1 hemophore HasA [Yersinia mollaretii]
MSTTIQYNSEFADHSITSYLNNWAESFGDIDQAATKDRGQFAGGGMLDGTQYSIGSSHDTGMGMIVEGTLTYAFAAHAFHGQINSMQFGKDLVDNPNGVGKILDEVQVTFNGLDISGEFDTAKSVAENRDTDMQKSVHGLMKGNADPMLDILKAKGIDVDTKFKDLDIASQLDTTSDVMADAPVVDTVGASDNVEILMAA